MSSAGLPGTSRLARSAAIAQRPWRLQVLLWGTGVGLIAVAAGLRLARRALDSYDAQIMFAVSKSIATTHTTYVPRAADPFGMMSPHSTYGLGLSLMEVPAYLLAVHTGRQPESLAMLVNPVLFGAVAVVVWAWARAASATEMQAVGAALATSFGTLLLAYTATGFSEMGTALGVAVAILGVELAGRKPLIGGGAAGAGVGVAVLFRPDSVLLVAIPVAIAVLLRTRRGLPLFLLAACPGSIVTLAYNWGSGGLYAHQTLSQLFIHPLAMGVYGLLLSPGRGLLLYVPLVLPALLAVPWAWRRSPVVTGLCLVLLAIRVPFYATFWSWMGGWTWGTRYLVPAMPCLAPLLFEIVRRFSWRRWPLVAAGSLVLALSVSVQLVGAAVRYDTDTVNLKMTEVWGSDANSAPRDSVMFDWRYFPILEHVREIRQGRNLAPGYRGGVGLPFN